MDKRKVWICIIWFNVIMALCGINFFLLGKDFSAGQIENSIKIGACYSDMSNSYFDVLNNEISSVVEEHGDLLITRDAKMNQETQNEQIKKLIEEGVEAIFITPVEWKGIDSALEAAKEKGIIVVAVDSTVYHDELVDCIVTSDNYDAGLQLANYLMSQENSARIVLLEHLQSKSSQDRIQGFKDGISGNEGYQVVIQKSCNGQIESAMTAMEQVINSGIEFNSVFAINDPCALGTIAAMEKLEVKSNIRILGMDGSPAGKSMIKEEKIMTTAAQFPAEMGGKAVESMYKLLAGNEVEKEILVPVRLITKYTINSYDTDKWQ